MSDHAMKFSRQIPAQPGWFVISLLSDETGFPVAVDQESIVAWAFEEGDECSIPYPVTMGGVRTDDPVIVNPAGSVDSVGHDTAPTLACWLADAQEAHRTAKGGR